MKCRLECIEIGVSYEGVEVNKDDEYGIMNPNFTKEENQEEFFRTETWTYKDAMYRILDKIIESGEYTDEENKEYRQYRNEIIRCDNHFECSSNMVNSYIEFSGPLVKVLEFEKTYYNIKPINTKEAKDLTPKKNFIQCHLCNKKFYDSIDRKLKLKYQLKHHQKSCSKQYMKKRRRMVVEFLKESADQDIIDSIFEEYKDIIILDD